MNLNKKWDESHRRIPKDKSVSAYAVDKEKTFERNSAVLDLGGGTGVDAIYFAQQGHSVILADISEYALKTAKEKATALGVQIDTAQTTLGNERLPFEDSTFDIVYSRLVLHYFDQNTTSNIFKDINKVLKPGGKTFLTLKSPNDEKEMAFLKENSREIEPNVFVEDGDTKSRYSVEQLEKMLSNAGIEDYEVNEYTEDLGGRVDKVKSGNKVLLLNEVSWIKR